MLAYLWTRKAVTLLAHHPLDVYESTIMSSMSIMSASQIDFCGPHWYTESLKNLKNRDDPRCFSYGQGTEEL